MVGSHLPAVIVTYFVWPDLWDKVSILCLVLVSIYAVVITADGRGPAAEALQKADKNQGSSS